MSVQTCSLFRAIPDWDAHLATFEDYKLRGVQPNFYGRDANLSHPDIHHIHLATEDHIIQRWAVISETFYRTHDPEHPEEDYWLIYAYDNVLDSYLLLTIIGPSAHSDEYRSVLRGLYLEYVEPWINGRLSCAQ